MLNTSIFVTFQKEGIHRYPAAGTNPALADVSFLAHPHRHIFHFTVEVEVFHDDRDLEFILEKRFMESLFSERTLQIDFKSCEMLASDLMGKLLERYERKRNITITVSEDGENGGILKYTKD